MANNRVQVQMKVVDRNNDNEVFGTSTCEVEANYLPGIIKFSHFVKEGAKKKKSAPSWVAMFKFVFPGLRRRGIGIVIAVG